jgi:hypothetical protein
LISVTKAATCSRKPLPVSLLTPRKRLAALCATRSKRKRLEPSIACTNHRTAGLSIAPYESLGRVEEVERVGRGRGVDDEQIPARVVTQGVDLLHRHVLLRARERRGDVAVEYVRKDAVAALDLGASCATRPSNVALVSTRMIVRRPLAGTPTRASSAGSTSCASVVDQDRPRLWASLRAGSIVRHSTRFPRRAAATAKAAEVVVFPTPPQPTESTTRRPSSKDARDGASVIEAVLARSPPRDGSPSAEARR